MKCPKCGYLGFEAVDRCRHCGYEFALSTTSAAAPAPDLPIRTGDTAINPLDDLSLIDGASAQRVGGLAQPATDIDRLAAPAVPVQQGVSMAIEEELPLFGGPIADDQPLITKPSPPRPPLAVRRSTPEVPRVRDDQLRLQSLDFPLDLELPPSPSSGAVTPGERASNEPWPEPKPRPEPAGIAARFFAVALDLVLLAAVDVIVVYFTMQICGLTVADLGILPKGPLVAFILVQNGGYLVAFTAGGQTLGKMAAGIRVVPAQANETLDLGRAFARTFMWVVLAVPAGLGFLTLLGRDHRGLHDRFAGTRVIRASV